MSRRPIFLPLALATALFAALGSALAADFLINDWEDRLSDNTLNGTWYFVTDEDSQGDSKIISGDTLFAPTSIDSTSFAPGYGGSSFALKRAFIFGTIRPV